MGCFQFYRGRVHGGARPTIVSTGAGASELIIEGENGFTFKNGDAEALAGVIDRVMSIPEARRREIGANGRETIRSELDPARIAEQRRAAYEEAISSFHSSPPQRPNEWLVNMLTPRPGPIRDFDALLSPVPLRAMGKHMAHRIRNKLLAKIS
ncbi:MAG: glycosyltransferase [Hyphomicrobiaceae bacterium]